MTANHVIVAGTDGTPESAMAVEWALQQAARMGAHLRVVVAYSIPSYPSNSVEGTYMSVDDGSLRQHALDTAQEVCDRAAALEVSVDSHVLPGDPTALLLEESRDADILVIGTSGSYGFTDQLFGSVSAVLPSRAYCPVVVVPQHHEGSPFIPIERVVVGVDGSDSSARALRRAVDVGDIWDARVSAVSTVPFTTGNSLLAWMPPVLDHEKVMQDIREGLNVAVDQVLDGRDVKVARHVLDGNPAELLAEFSTAVDLIVVGCRGRGGFTGMLLGSTSRELLARSTCPVMVVPTGHRERTKNGEESQIHTPWKRA